MILSYLGQVEPWSWSGFLSVAMLQNSSCMTMHTRFTPPIIVGHPSSFLLRFRRLNLTGGEGYCV